MPTFTSAAVRPGTYIRFSLQTRPPAVLPTFVTAILGRTSEDRPTYMYMCRNSVPAQLTLVDQTTRKITVSLTTDSDETIRRDRLTNDDANMKDGSGNFYYISPTIVDLEGGQSYNYGFDQDWVYTEITGTTNKLFIEWLAAYRVSKTAPSTDKLFAAAAGDDNVVVQLARGTSDSQFDAPANVTPVTLSEGVGHNLALYTDGGGTYTITLDDNATPTPITPLTPGSFFETELTAGGTYAGETVCVRVNIDKMMALFSGVTAPTTYTNNIQVVTRGPRIGAATTGTDQSLYGGIYFVEYNIKKTITDFVPALFDNHADTKTFHGAITEDMTTDYLSWGTRPYFDMGGNIVYEVPLKDYNILGTGYEVYDLTTDSGYQAAVEDALELLKDIPEVTCIIPLTPLEKNYRPGIINAIKNHVNQMSSTTNNKPRISILGARSGNTFESTIKDTVQYIHDRRIGYPTISTLTKTVDSFTKTCNGSALASAMAGLLSSGIDAGEPISGKTITAFDSITDPFTRTQKDRLGEVYGAIVVENQGGVPTIVHFLSTDITDALTSEFKVAVIETDIRNTLKSALDKLIINTRFTSQTVGTVSSLIGMLLSQKVTIGVIEDFKIVSVTRNAIEPRQLDVKLQVLPMLDLNWLYIDMQFTTSS